MNARALTSAMTVLFKFDFETEVLIRVAFLYCASKTVFKCWASCR
jgi:hypothetical protein